MLRDGPPPMHHLDQPPALPQAPGSPDPGVPQGRQRLSLLEQRKHQEQRRTQHFLFQGPRHQNREPRRGRPQKIPQRPLSELLPVRAHRRRTPPKSPRHSRHADGDIPQDRAQGREGQTRVPLRAAA